MFWLAIMAATANPAPDQILAGHAFERLAAQADTVCPAKRIRSITPGDLDYAQEGFEVRLSRSALARLQSANMATRRCAGRNGLSCQTTVTLEAMDRVGMMAKFTSYVCTSPVSAK